MPSPKFDDPSQKRFEPPSVNRQILVLPMFAASRRRTIDDAWLSLPKSDVTVLPWTMPP
jgi:hypothetical protein